jgi:hypothetical protein
MEVRLELLLPVVLALGVLLEKLADLRAENRASRPPCMSRTGSADASGKEASQFSRPGAWRRDEQEEASPRAFGSPEGRGPGAGAADRGRGADGTTPIAAPFLIAKLTQADLALR